MGELCAGTHNYTYIFFIINNFQTLEETIYICIENKKPPSYFKTLLETLKVLCDFFYGDLTPRDETLTRMKLLLQLYASDSAELIGRYHWNRFMQFHTNVCSVVLVILPMQCPSCCNSRIKEQRALQAGEYKMGSITIRAQLLRDHLRVEVGDSQLLQSPVSSKVLNARHLKPPEVHRGSLAEKMKRSGRLGATKSNINMTRSGLPRLELSYSITGSGPRRT